MRRVWGGADPLMESTNSHAAKQMAVLGDVRTYVEKLPNVSLRDLDDVTERLQHNDYLVAVFGAFSAGKSSLLNALLGEPLLVVSPNPTTASVTQIRSATDGVGEIRVTAKSADELWRDVESALSVLHLKPQDLASGMAMVEHLDAKQFSTSLRRHIRFLKATREGYDAMQHRLGSTWTATVEDLRSFSADERYAAYVSRVDVFADHQTLRRGFVFVDTPGVDSIHRRHTDVAFRYMRHADAVLFVMYYTHAFTQGDRDFLLQLSGVQDVAETNKLFAVINAVDLAKSDDERQAVRNRVDRELRQMGIRFPRVYEVSAQLAQAARQLEQNPADETAIAMVKARLGSSGEESGILTPVVPERLLEQSGLPLLEQDLMAYVTASSERLLDDRLKRMLLQLDMQLEELIAVERMRQMSADAEGKNQEARLIELERELQQQLDASVLEKDASILQSLSRELDELQFHAGERIRLRYRDIFRLAFQPGRFRVGKSAEKLREAGEELTDSLARQIAIEARTLSLRADALVERKVESLVAAWNRRFVSEGVARIDWAPELERGIVRDSVEAIVSESVIRPFYRYYSSSKQFFEEGGQKSMMDDSESAIVETVKEELARLADEVKSHATLSLMNSMTDVLRVGSDRVHTMIDSTRQPFDAAKLELYEQGKRYLEEIQND